MCGIIGKISFNTPICQNEFIAQRDTMTSRGPNQEGLYFNSDKKIALGYRRLSINDLSELGNQPISNEDSTILLICNGEIYNSPTLKEELIKRGHHFKSRSDAEVIIHGYEEWGTEILKRIEGMFALGIWDSKKEEIIIARDRFGIKPLYFENTIEGFTFASSLNAITTAKNHQKKFDFSSICDYLTYRYVPSPKSIYQGICKLEPAQFLVLTAQKKIQIQYYWEIEYKPIKMSAAEVQKQFEHLLRQSVRKHLMSDVPVGCFLSSGYDSSTLALLMTEENYQPQTFSLGYSDWDESEHLYAQKTADILKLNNRSLIIDQKDFIPENFINAYDEPIADISIIPTFCISNFASKKVKTLFSGEGADELLGGYDWHRKIMQTYSQRSIYDRLFRNFNPTALEIYKDYMAMGKFDREELFKLFSPEQHQNIPENTYWFFEQSFRKDFPLLKAIQYMDIRGFMGELVLGKIDRSSMAHSLEVRVPYLDYELFDFLFNLEPDAYFSLVEQKKLLANILKPKLPHVLNRKKQGFVGPDKYYNRSAFYEQILKKSVLIEIGLLSKKYIQELIFNNDHWRLWKIVILELWWQKNI
ncbi:MAG: asparagine synthase (glutamine-hydrolyzing) [Bacteroidales bacterium]|nr:asparagine synthase (glutamine-hydrolyzing) [Bacteroidales bacterium]